MKLKDVTPSDNVRRIGKPAKAYKCSTDAECEAEEAATERKVAPAPTDGSTWEEEKARRASLDRRKRNRSK